MKLIGKKVTHKKFGEGIILSQNKDCICVKFAAESNSRKFQYPDCFKSFLQLMDSEASEEIKAAIEQSDKIIKEVQRNRYETAQARIFANRISTQSIKSETKNLHSAFSSVSAFCSEYDRAVSEEIRCLKSNGGRREQVFDGKLIMVHNGRCVYTFEGDTEMNFPEGTPINIWQGETSVPASVISCEDFTITLSTHENLGDSIPTLEFSADTWRLLNELKERLLELDSFPFEIVKSLVCDGMKSIDFHNSSITTGQNNALKMANEQPITFIWGPPGTGKTQTLANIVLSHIKADHTVLMLSYSNVSVDGAAMRVMSLYPNFEPGEIIRYGYPRQPEILEHPYLSSYNLVIHNHPLLMKERDELVKQRKHTSRESQKYVQINRRLTEIRKRLSDEEKESLQTASFVATTVSKAIADNAIRSVKFDVVIFDEASMAYVPQIVFSASLAKSHFICMGDFRQLPPIVQSGAKSILNDDIFQYCGISSAVDKGHNHKWLCMLNTQYRMHPNIADFASFSMYNKQLCSDLQMKQKRTNIVDSAPMLGYPLAFADLSGMMSVCSKSSDGSRFNILSAFISFGLATAAASNHDAAIISPYRAQSKLLNAMARDIESYSPQLHKISCATVHQFQGSEKDVVIYDAVDCYRMPFPGKLIASNENNYANRLFNVALTRSKGKFICVANIDYMENKNLSDSLMFKKMIRLQKASKSKYSESKLVDELKALNESALIYYKSEHGESIFLDDLSSAKHEIRIDIPNAPQNSASFDKMAGILMNAKKRGVKVYIRAENKSNLPTSIRGLSVENNFVTDPVVLLDKKVVWYGMPLSGAKFKTEGRELQTKFYPVFRLVGTHTAKSLYGLLNMNITVDRSNQVSLDEHGTPEINNFFSFVLAKKKCPACGKPMKVNKSKKGKYFLACTGYPDCKSTALIEPELVERYFYRNGGRGQLCPRCGCSLEAKVGPYGLYIQCCGGMRHKFKIEDI